MADAAASVKQDDDRSFEHELAGKYLTIKLKDEFYGVPIRPIGDIIEIQEYTEVPQTADYVKGVINLRGTVIPVIDLRKKFGMEEREYDKKTCIIVVSLDEIQTGLIVDRVEEVLEFADEEIDPAPSMSSQVQVKFIAGIGKKEDEVYILLELEKILAEEEVDELVAAAEQHEE